MIAEKRKLFFSFTNNCCVLSCQRSCMPYFCFWFTQGLFNNIDRAGKGFLVFKVIKHVSASIPPGHLSIYVAGGTLPPHTQQNVRVHLTFQGVAAASMPPQTSQGLS